MTAIAQGRTDAVSQGAARARRARRLPVARAVKIAGALGVLALGAYALTVEAGFIASDGAVVSAYSLSVRSPIEGYAHGLSLRVGAGVDRGGVLARISNPRVDDRRLVDLRERVGRLRAEVEASAAAKEDLLRLRAGLQDRAREHTRALQARLAGQVAEADRAASALVAKRDQARREADRKGALGASGATSQAEVERTRAAYEVAAREADAGAAHAAALRTEVLAAARGIMSSPGMNDVAYSAQRMDEVELRLTDTNRAAALAAAALEEARRVLAAEERRVALLQETELAAPHPGMVWKIGASEGERLAPGEAVAQLVDCGAAFLLAAVPQSAVSRVEIGSTAEFRLSGESLRRTGQVLSIAGETGPGGERLVALPPERPGGSVLVRIAAPPSDNTSGGCLIGRTARVLLPVSGGGWLDRVLRAFS